MNYEEATNHINQYGNGMVNGKTYCQFIYKYQEE